MAYTWDNHLAEVTGANSAAIDDSSHPAESGLDPHRVRVADFEYTGTGRQSAVINKAATSGSNQAAWRIQTTYNYDGTVAGITGQETGKAVPELTTFQYNPPGRSRTNSTTRG
jgi:hypothetical protein